MDWLLLAVSVLAAFRLALMLSEEEGPLSAFSIMRRKLPRKTNPGRGIRCLNCVAIWASIALSSYLFTLQLISLELLPIYIFAIAGGATLLNRFSKESA